MQNDYELSGLDNDLNQFLSNTITNKQIVSKNL